MSEHSDGFSVEELIKALQRVLQVEPGATAYRHPHGIGILNAAGRYAGVAGLPPAPADAQADLVDLPCGHLGRTDLDHTCGAGRVVDTAHDWNALPLSLQAQLLDGIEQANRGETVDRGDFSQYLTDETGGTDG